MDDSMEEAKLGLNVVVERKTAFWKRIVAPLVCGIVFVTGFLFMYAGQDGVGTRASAYWTLSSNKAVAFAAHNLQDIRQRFKPKAFSRRNLSFDRIASGETEAAFDINGHDVIVFLHMQKTAGTALEKALTHNLDLPVPCECSKGRKKCQCFRPRPGSKELWLFSRYSTGWSCGLHADWTELVVSNCVDNMLDKREGLPLKRRYFYTTMLRDPLARYISEFRHVQRGATWRSSLHICNGRPPTAQELPACYNPDAGWEDVSLDEFLDCPHNLANNRQTRMLADLTLVHCYNRSAMSVRERDRVMLASAKQNLASMAFFGLQESMHESQYMFERIFRLKFTKSLVNLPPEASKSQDTPVSDQQLERLHSINALDIELYNYAKALFDKRFQMLKAEDPMFEFNFAV